MRYFAGAAAAMVLGVLLSASALAEALPAASASLREGDSIVFPADAGVIDVTKPPYNVVGDGKTDCTAAIQKALDDHPNQGAIIYLPNGKYLISDTLKWPHGKGGGGEEKNTILQGQAAGQSKTVLVLRDATPAFMDPAKPRAMIVTGWKPAQRFRNAVRDLTVDVGSRNPGAIGVQFNASNQGCMRRVSIVAGEGSGLIGLDMSYTDEIGPLLIKDIAISGFDVGIAMSYGVDSMTLEGVELKGCRKFAVQNKDQCVTIRQLSAGSGKPLVWNGGQGLMVLLDSSINSGPGDAEAVANGAGLFARNLRMVGGGGNFIRSGTAVVKGDAVKEFVSHKPLSLFPSPEHSLGLPVKETPGVPWDDLKDWANGAAGAKGGDITAPLQAAIDSGKTTVYIPRGTWRIRDTIRIRGAVRRLIGCEAWLDIENPLSGREAPMFRFEDGAAPVVVVERMATGFARGPFYFMEHAARRTLVLSSIAVNFDQTGAYRSTGPGDLFIEDVVGADWRFVKQNVWARQFNVENTGRHVLNDGGTLWILGLKTEGGGTLIETRAGGRTELLGGFCYTCTPSGPDPMFVIDNASASFTIGEAAFNGKPYEILVRETRGGVTKELRRADAPGRMGGCLLPLYVGYEGK